MTETALKTPFPVAENVARMQPSSTLAAMQAAIALRNEGHDVVDFGPGEPDFDTPAHIKEAAARAMQAGQTKYTPTGGTKKFQESVAAYYEREFGARVNASEVMATAGGKQGIFNAVVTLCGPGDDVLIPKPYWVTFPEIVTFAGARPVYIETEETGFQLTAEQVESAITPRTKLIIINSPSNPSGRVIPPAEFERIMRVVAERGIYAVSDECYLKFVYEPAEVFSAATLAPELRERLCIAGSFSKTYAMTGWRIGYTIAPAAWTREMSKVQSHSTSNPSSISQAAAIDAFDSDADLRRRDARRVPPPARLARSKPSATSPASAARSPKAPSTSSPACAAASAASLRPPPTSPTASCARRTPSSPTAQASASKATSASPTPPRWSDLKRASAASVAWQRSTREGSRQ